MGCRRGTLRNALSQVVLCPSTDSDSPSITLDLGEVASDAESTLAAAQTANDYLLEWTRQQECTLHNMECLGTSMESESSHQAFTTAYRNVFARFNKVCMSDGSTPTTSGKEIVEAMLLRDTIIAILWELQHSLPSLGSLPKGHILHDMTLSDLGALLCSAALYQIEEDTVSI